MAGERKGRVPRTVKVIVPLFALGLVWLLVSLAWRADETTKVDGGPPVDPIDGVATTTDAFLACTECHGDLDLVFKQGRAPLLRYTHADHFAQGVSDCSVCHPVNTHEPDKINRPTMSRCFTCHGLTDVAIASGECQLCHPADIPDRPPSHQEANWLATAHPEQALDDQFQCLTCHEQQSFCDSCHGLPMPHEEGWENEPHTVVFFEDPSVCQDCHPRAQATVDDCDRCHHPQVPRGTPWLEAHPSVVKEASAFTCFECHSEVTCSACHVRGNEDFGADQQVVASSPAPSPTGG